MYTRSVQQRFGLGDANSDRVKAEVTAAANKYGVDPQLALLIAQHESAFNQTNSSGGTLTSSAGALGVMQLMPQTAAGLGVDPRNEQQNIDGGVRLLSQLLNQFNGNVTNAVAAYSAGPGAVQKYGGVPPYAETQNYVAFINANYGGPGISSPSSDVSSDPSISSDSSSFDLSSYFPSSDSSYDIGGVVLSGSELAILGVAGLVVLLAFSRL